VTASTSRRFRARCELGERVVDVVYVTDLLGVQIVSPTRQAAIKRALIQLLAGVAARGEVRVRQLSNVCPQNLAGSPGLILTTPYST
jgi:hypothetical protein